MNHQYANVKASWELISKFRGRSVKRETCRLNEMDCSLYCYRSSRPGSFLLDSSHSKTQLVFNVTKASWARWDIKYIAVYGERRKTCYDFKDLNQEKINV